MIRRSNDRQDLPATECDVCILGGGPAGITLAAELAGARPDLRVVLLEAGGDSPPTPAQNDPYVTDAEADDVYPVAASRLRYLGGTSNHWGGWCRALDPEDFEPRASLPFSGWPFDRSTLEPYYRRAVVWCECGSVDDAESEHLARQPDLLDVSGSTLLRHKIFRFSPPTRFGTRHRERLAAPENLECWLHATALTMKIVDRSVVSVEVANDDRSLGALRAKHVVVAMGGLETTRFLLLHRGEGGRSSGLSSPMLGVGFADHLGYSPATAVLPKGLRYSRREASSGSWMPVLSLTAEAQRRLGLRNVAIMPRPTVDRAALHADYPGNEAFGFRSEPYATYRLTIVCEPRVSLESRVLLGATNDRHGRRRLRLDWRRHPEDGRHGERLLTELARELGRRAIGRLKPHLGDDGFDRTPQFAFHHMGSTRMSASSDTGVVDAHGRVHGIENLWIASSSTFPAFGFSNPTLTIVAMAIRLADHLARS